MKIKVRSLCNEQNEVSKCLCKCPWAWAWCKNSDQEELENVNFISMAGIWSILASVLLFVCKLTLNLVIHLQKLFDKKMEFGILHILGVKLSG